MMPIPITSPVPSGSRPMIRLPTTESSDLSTYIRASNNRSESISDGETPIVRKQPLARTFSDATVQYISRGYDKYKARRKQSYTAEKLDLQVKHKLISRKRAEMLRAMLNATYIAGTEEQYESSDGVSTSVEVYREVREVPHPWSQSPTHAVLSGFQRYVSALLDEAQSDNTLNTMRAQVDQFGRSALHYAAFLGEINACRYLLEAEWKQAPDSLGRTPLHYAALGNKAAVIELILSQAEYARVQSAGNSRSGIVLDAARIPRLGEILKQMQKFRGKESTPRFLQMAEAVDSQDADGRTPLHLAVLSSSFLSVQALCHQSCDALLCDNTGKRAIDLSSTDKITRFLLFYLRSLRDKQTTVSFDARDLELLSPLQLNEAFIGPAKDTYFISAVKQADLNAVSALLAKGADMTVENYDGWNAVHVVVGENRLDLLQFLVEGSGADHKLQLPTWTANLWQAMDQPTSKGYNLLHIAALYGTPELMQYVSEVFIRRGRLLAAGRDLPPGCLAAEYKAFHAVMESQCSKGFTPFLLATKAKRLEIMTILVKHNCDIYKKTNLLQNALHLAALSKRRDLIDYVLYLDSDYNVLKNDSDFKARRPKELDTIHHSFMHPWDLVKTGKTEKLLELIREGKVEVNAGTHALRNSLLHVALLHKQVFCVRELIKLGANPKLQNSEGQTAFDLLKTLKDSRYEQIASRLLAGEANLTNSEISIEQIERLYFRRDSFFDTEPKAEAGEVVFDPQVFYVLKEIRDALLYRKLSIADIYTHLDLNKDFTLSKKEFAEALSWLNVQVHFEHFEKLLASLDPKRRSRVSYSRLVSHFQALLRVDHHYQELDAVFEAEKHAQKSRPRLPA